MNKLTVSNDQFKALVSSLCRDVARSGWQPDYIVGITRGGAVAAVMISQWFDTPCEMLKVSLRHHGGENPTESNLWMAEDAFGYAMDRPKNILIVDDINDTGATINWIMEDWQSSCFPDDPRWLTVWNNTVRFATLYDNLASKCQVKMDYVGAEINKAENDQWVDFPWEDWWTK